jgi:hypothetical protein
MVRFESLSAHRRPWGERGKTTRAGRNPDTRGSEQRRRRGPPERGEGRRGAGLRARLSVGGSGYALTQHFAAQSLRAAGPLHSPMTGFRCRARRSSCPGLCCTRIWTACPAGPLSPRRRWALQGPNHRVGCLLDVSDSPITHPQRRPWGERGKRAQRAKGRGRSADKGQVATAGSGGARTGTGDGQAKPSGTGGPSEHQGPGAEDGRRQGRTEEARGAGSRTRRTGDKTTWMWLCLRAAVLPAVYNEVSNSSQLMRP